MISDHSLLQLAQSSSRRRMNPTDPAPPGLHPNSRNPFLCSEGRFRFTPIKTFKPAPRLWDRKPSTPLAAGGPGPRKLWKRVRPSLDKMKLQRSIAAVTDNQEELNTEINDARNWDYLRGVKRRFVRLRDGDSVEGRALFLETKWELEISRKRRKLPAGCRTPQLSDGPSAAPSANNERDTATAAAVRELTAEQESKLVRSALRSSLDGEDTAVLNNFLSKAQAKRAAKAVAAQYVEESTCHETSEISCHTPPRKALVNLDANTPSPAKAQITPCKANGSENTMALTELESKGENDNDQQPASPATRRSTRARQPPSVRNTFLRRAKGTEFIFRARAEEQDVEVKTRANTLQNKGDALLPKAALKAMAKPPAAESLPFDKEVLESRDETLEGKHTHKKAGKHVSWRKLRFVEYESGLYDDYFSDSSCSDIPTDKEATKCKAKHEPTNKGSKSSSRSARSARRGSKKAGEKNADETSGATTSPNTKKVRRVRRLGPRTVNVAIDTFDTPVDASATDYRKKSKPSSPRAARLAAPASKKATATGSSSNRSGQSTSSSKKIVTAHAGSTPKPKRVRAKG